MKDTTDNRLVGGIFFGFCLGGLIVSLACYESERRKPHEACFTREDVKQQVDDATVNGFNIAKLLKEREAR